MNVFDEIEYCCFLVPINNKSAIKNKLLSKNKYKLVLDIFWVESTQACNNTRVLVFFAIFAISIFAFTERREKQNPILNEWVERVGVVNPQCGDRQTSQSYE